MGFFLVVFFAARNKTGMILKEKVLEGKVTKRIEPTSVGVRLLSVLVF